MRLGVGAGTGLGMGGAVLGMETPADPRGVPWAWSRVGI